MGEASGKNDRVTFLKLVKLFAVMFKIGSFTFGGGLVMITQMSREFAGKYGWLDDEEVVDFFAVAQSLPGVVAINASMLVGYKVAGVIGGIVAAIGSILPSFLVLLVVAVFYEGLKENPYALGALRGIKAAVIALMFNTVLKMRKGVLTGVFSWLLFALAAALCLFTDINVAFIILGGALAGLVFSFIKQKREARMND